MIPHDLKEFSAKPQPFKARFPLIPPPERGFKPWLCRHEDGILKVCIVLMLLGMIWLMSGCASIPADSAQAHEERHCAGWKHQVTRRGEFPIFYEWTKTRPASAKPWVYLYVENVDAACRYQGADAVGNIERIGGCAIWHPVNCIIILPKT